MAAPFLVARQEERFNPQVIKKILKISIGYGNDFSKW